MRPTISDLLATFHEKLFLLDMMGVDDGNFVSVRFWRAELETIIDILEAVQEEKGVLYNGEKTT